MTDLFGLGAKPVDQLALRLLLKSPWWAKAPEEARFEERNLIVQIKCSPNLFKAPPKEVKNRIGEICHSAMIIGYAWRGRQEFKKLKPRKKIAGLNRSNKHQSDEERGESNGHQQVWYVLFDNGLIQPVGGDTINRWHKLSGTEWKSRHFANEDFQGWQRLLCLRVS